MTAGTADLSSHHYSFTPCSCAGKRSKKTYLLTPTRVSSPVPSLTDLGELSGIEMSGRSSSVESLDSAVYCDMSTGPFCSTMVYPQGSTPTKKQEPKSQQPPESNSKDRSPVCHQLQFDSLCEEMDSQLSLDDLTMVVSTLSTPEKVVLKRAISDTITSVFNLNESCDSMDLQVGSSLRPPSSSGSDMVLSPLGARPPCIGQEASPFREPAASNQKRATSPDIIPCRCRASKPATARSSIRSTKFSPIRPSSTKLEDSIDSDVTSFMDKPLSRVAVTKQAVVAIEKCKKKSILGKLKKYCKHLQRKSGENTADMETLAVL